MIEPPQNKHKTRQVLRKTAIQMRLEMDCACGDVKKSEKIINTALNFSSQTSQRCFQSISAGLLSMEEKFY